MANKLDKLKRQDVVLHNSETRILWAIYELLLEMDKKLDKADKPERVERVSIEKPKVEVEIEKETISRIEIVEKIKSLPANKRPAGWTKKPNGVLVEFLEKEGLI